MNTLDYFTCDIVKEKISSEQDILDIFGKMYPLQKLLIYDQNLTQEFFDLSTGIAGSILQKLVNYEVKTAFIVDTENIKSVKFREMVNELNQGKLINFFSSKKDAIEWLCKN